MDKFTCEVANGPAVSMPKFLFTMDSQALDTGSCKSISGKIQGLPSPADLENEQEHFVWKAFYMRHTIVVHISRCQNTVMSCRSLGAWGKLNFTKSRTNERPILDWPISHKGEKNFLSGTG